MDYHRGRGNCIDPGDCRHRLYDRALGTTAAILRSAPKMGTTEEIGKAATATIEALRSTPVILALVIFNVLFMGLSTYAMIKVNERWDHEIERWVELVKSCQTALQDKLPPR